MITQEKFKDININFNPHPNTGDLSTVSNEKSIAQSLKILFYYNYYDVPFQSKLGSNLRAKLFDLISDVTSEVIRTEIKTLISNYEPRVELIDINVEVSNEKQGVNVELVYRARTSTEEIVVNYFLNRII